MLGDELQDFAFCDGRGGLGEDCEDFQGAVGDHQLEGAGEEEVANEDGGLVAEDGVGAGETAAEEAFIDDVVMQEGGGVDEFDAGGERDMANALVAAHACGCEGQERAEALSTGGDDVGGELWDEGDGAVHLLHDCLIGCGEIGADEVDERCERVAALPLRTCRSGSAGQSCRLDWRHDDTQTTLPLTCFLLPGTISAGLKQGQGGDAVITAGRAMI